jgi:peptide methionine sulfoxide reductase MsrB
MNRLNRIIKKVLKETKSDLDKLIEFGEYAELVNKSEMKIMNEFLLLIRDSGIVNMNESVKFLFMTKDHFDAMIGYMKFERGFDEKTLKVLKEASTKIETVRNIIISAAMRYLENQDKELTNENMQPVIRRILISTLNYYRFGMLPI